MVICFVVYVLKVLEMILAGQFGRLKSGKEERFGYEGPASNVGFDFLSF